MFLLGNLTDNVSILEAKSASFLFVVVYFPWISSYTLICTFWFTKLEQERVVTDKNLYQNFHAALTLRNYEACI